MDPHGAVLGSSSPTTTASTLLASSRQQLTARIQALAAAVDQGELGAGFEQLVQGIRQFWRYSVLNTCFLFHQFPQATSVMGRRQWEAAGRTVKAGAQPILIRAPRSSTSPWPFVVVEVFDIAQTDGPAVPPADLLPIGDSTHVLDIERAAQRLKVEVEERAYLHVGLREVHGLARDRHHIVVEARLQGAARASVLLHELGHALLHFDGMGRDVRTRALVETEAEAVAHVVQQVLGLDSHAPTYIEWMGGDAATVLRSLQRIQVAARMILDAMQGHRCRGKVPGFKQRSSSRASVASRKVGRRRGEESRVNGLSRAAA